MEKCSNLFKSVQSSHELALRYPKVRMKFSGFFISLSLSMASIAHAADSSDWQTPTRDSVQKMAVTLNQTVKLWPVPGLIFRIEDFGAVGDGLTLNTVAIQKAIDVCSAAGGGTVLVHAGDYVTGTIEFKTGVTLQIDRGARILGSLHSADYPDKTPAHLTAMDTILHITKSLIYAEGCDHIGIRGQGIIDGRGVKKNWPRKNTGPHPPVNDRPFLIRVIECRNVEMDGIHLRDSASWICERMGLKPTISFGGGSRGWIGDSPFIFLDTARIRSLGWKATLTIRQSVENTIDFLIQSGS